MPVFAVILAVGGCAQNQISTEQTNVGGDTPQAGVDVQANGNENTNVNPGSVNTNQVIKPIPVPQPPLEFEVVIHGDGKFDPGSISVKLGRTVIWHVTSPDGDHGIGLDAYNINRAVNKGTQVDVQFVADKPGTFAYFCNTNCDPVTSLDGKFVVQE